MAFRSRIMGMNFQISTRFTFSTHYLLVEIIPSCTVYLKSQLRCMGWGTSIFLFHQGLHFYWAARQIESIENMGLSFIFILINDP